MSESTRRTGTPPSLATIATRGLVVTGFSVIANAVVLVVAGDLLDVAPGFDPISWTPVVLLTVLGAIAATAVYGAITRLSANHDQLFTRLAAVVLVLSFVPDVLLLQFDPAATIPGVLVLMIMHVTVAAIAVGTLTRD